MRYAPYLLLACFIVSMGCRTADTEDGPAVADRYDAEDELVGDVIGTDERLRDECSSGWLCAASAPKLTITPREPTFVQIDPFEIDVMRITLKNEGTANLRIGALDLIESDADDAREVTPADSETRQFFEVFDRGGLIFVAPGAQLKLAIEWAPINDLPDDTILAIECNDPNQTSRQVTLTTPISSPLLTSSTPEVDFPRVRPDQSDSKVLTLENTGNDVLRLVGFELDGAARDDFSVSYPDAAAPDDASRDATDSPRRLEPGEEVLVRVTFSPRANFIREATLRVLSDSSSGEEFLIPLTGNTGPCLDVVKPVDFDGVIDFGEAAIGRTNTKTLELQNCAEEAQLTIDRIGIEGDGFTLADEDGGPEWPITLRAGDTVSYEVVSLPEMEAIYGGLLTIVHDDPSWPDAQIELAAKGVQGRCPEALAEATVVGDSGRPATEIITTPLTTIQLRGINSRDPDGMVQRYEWNILSAPIDSGTRLAPSNRVENPKLFLDVAGEYEIELMVYNRLGEPSCESSKVTILAEYRTDIHIQLTWNTPGDPDQTDTFGTDLDLHYMRPGGSWNDTAYDVFWQNPTSDWGIPGNVADNPSLDFDDTDGLGPENINHDNPLSGQKYITGVYYKDDRGFGDSYATVRIYVDGQLKFEVLDKQLEESNIFWDVASIEWPSQTVLLRDRIFTGFPR